MKNNKMLEEIEPEKLNIINNIIFKNALEVIFVLGVEDENRIYFAGVNSRFEKVTGLSASDLVGKTPLEATNKEAGKKLQENYRQCLVKRDVIKYREELEIKAGKRVLKTKLTPVIIEGKLEYIVGTAVDITEREKEKSKVKYLSFHDQLTGLYNRIYFENELERLNNSRNQPITLVVADIYNLNKINEKLGQRTGDDYIKMAADLIKSVTREEDIVARIGGDEFAAIFPHMEKRIARKIPERIYRKCQQVNQYSNHKYKLRLAVGTATLINSETDINLILKLAHKEMYEDKKDIEI